MRVLLLVHEDLVPPQSLEGLPESEVDKWKAEYDVSAAIAALGHDLEIVGVHSELKPIHDAIKNFKPKIVFNMLEEFRNEGIFDQHVVSHLELLGQKYTGCNPRGMVLARDKALTKKILTYHRIQVPKFVVIPRKNPRKSVQRLKFPVILKSLTEEASLAISKKSVVTNIEALRERVEYIHDHLQTDAIAEEYIEGREIYVGAIGNQRLQTFTPWELVIKNLADGEPNIATRQVKWNKKYQARKGVVTHAAKGLSEDALLKISKISKRIYRRLYMSGYARLDFRLAEDGGLYLLEANPNPNIENGEDFAESANDSGLDYNQLIAKILSLGKNSGPASGL